MWLRLAPLVIVGIAAFSHSVAIQFWNLGFAPSQWLLLVVALAGLGLFLRSVFKTQWQLSRRPSFGESAGLVLCLVLGGVSFQWNLPWLGTAAAVYYFGSIFSLGLPKAEWRVIRGFGCLSFLVAHPLADRISFFASEYSQWVLRGSSALLDAFSICSVVELNRIDGLQTSIVWQDVESSVLSCSALVAMSAFAIAWYRLRLIHTLLILPVTMAIGVLSTIGRIAIVIGLNAAGSAVWVNLLCFLIAAYLAWVWLCLVRFAFDPVLGKVNSGLITFWNRLTLPGLSALQLQQERAALAVANSETFRLPTIAAVKREAAKRSDKRFRWIRRTFRACKNGFFSVCSFIYVWFRSRRFRRLLPLVPLVFVAVAVGVIPELRPQVFRSERLLAEQYTVDLGKALESSDRDALKLLTNRLKQFSNLSDASQFALAQALIAIDLESEAAVIVGKLVDDLVNPYAPAQLWQAKRVLVNSTDPASYDRSLVKKYLRQASQDESLAAEANWLLGQILLQEGDDENALKCFRSITKPQPETLLMLALIYKSRGDNAAYRRCLVNAELTCKERLAASDPQANQMRLLLARSLQLQERFSEAVQVLEASPDFANDPIVRQAAIVVDIAWFHSLPGDQAKERKDRIQHALAVDRTNPLLQKTIAAIAISEPNDSELELRQLASKQIADSMNSATLSGTSMTILGTKSAELGELDEAEQLFRKAIAAGSPSPLAFNNLAWVLAQKSDVEQTKEALDLINRALAMNSRLPELWKTRSEIWEQQGRILEAIADLEKAIQLGDKSAELRVKVADLYELQGDVETAKKYRKLGSVRK